MSDTTPSEKAATPAPAKGKHDGNIACLTRPACSQLFFVYAGAQGMLEGMGPMTFLQKSGISDRNVAFIRDPHACFFDKGVSAEIPTLDALIDWHQAHIAAHPHVTEVYCVGNSFGGWAALFFGYMLAVKKVWALAPGGEWGRTLLMDLMDDSNGVTDYDIHYSHQLAEDKLFAESLRNYPGVRMIHNEEHGHLMIRGLLQNGDLPKLFPPFQAAKAEGANP